MEVFIFDKNLNAVDMISEYVSLIWTTRYSSCGDFELYLPASSENLKKLQLGRFLCRICDIDGARKKHMMVIEKIEVKNDAENGNFMTVTGRDLKSILYRRIIWNKVAGTVNLGLVITRLINENIISPEITERGIPNFRCAPVSGIYDTIDISLEYENLGETVEKLCSTYEVGFDVDVVGADFEFNLYEGTDRSYNQSDNAYILFSPALENLHTSDYVEDMTSFKNTVLVIGASDDKEQITMCVGEEENGIDRCETSVKSSTTLKNDESITREQYTGMLIDEGYGTVCENKVVKNFEGEIETQTTYKVGVDYFLGDLVQVMNEYGITATTRITEIIESDGAEGYKIIPTFSTWEV